MIQYVENILWHYIFSLDHRSITYTQKIGEMTPNPHPIAAQGGKDGLAELADLGTEIALEGDVP